MHQVLNPWLPGLFFINVKHRLLIIALKQYVDNFCLPVLEKSGKSQGIPCGLESGHPVLRKNLRGGGGIKTRSSGYHKNNQNCYLPDISS